MEVYPSVTIPSTGIFSPGFTIIMSFTLTSSTFTLISFPFFRIIAVLGLNPINLFIASDVFPFAFASHNLPKITIVINTALASK